MFLIPALSDYLAVKRDNMVVPSPGRLTGKFGLQAS